MLSKILLYIVVIFTSIAGPASLLAAEVYEIHIKDHQFIPASIHIHPDTKISLVIYNDDSTPEEFESLDFHREKIILGHGKVKISVGPLKVGTYNFFGEFHPRTACGKIIVE